MRRISRIDRSTDMFRARAITWTPPPYLCSSCKHRTAPFSISALRQAQRNIKEPFTEKLRKKIWGTDQPPGLEDPYGDPSFLEKKRLRQQAQEPEVDRRTAETVDLGSYEPATTWDGLERVGGYGNWWKDNWDPEHQFEGFLPAEVRSDPGELTAQLHRAMVEVFALKQAGRTLQDISNTAPGQDITQEVQLIPLANGVSLQFTDYASLEDVVQSLTSTADETSERTTPTESEEGVAADRSSFDPLQRGSTPVSDETAERKNPTESEEDVAADRSTEDPISHPLSAQTYESLIASWDPSWLKISLDDPEIKFAVVKRTMQLTGVRISDAAIGSSNNAKAVLNQLITPPKPRKLVEALSQKEQLINLPNVSIYAKRVTPIDKERSNGRWKLIEQQLQDRGLPVTGH